MIAFSTDPLGIKLFNVIGPVPSSRFPVPLLAPSPVTTLTFAQALSSALSVVDVTSLPLRNFLVSGDVNFIKEPTLAYFKFDVAKSPTTNAPPEVKYPVFVLVVVVVEFHVALKLDKSFVTYLR